MGGYGSGRQTDELLADEALFVDIAWMVRNGQAIPGACFTGTLQWTCRSRESGNINFECDMRAAENAVLVLRFTTKAAPENEKRSHVQRIKLSCTKPNFGGWRWWMHCPFNGQRVGKLYCPSGEEKFASRTAWKLGYQSQRIAERDRPFEALARLQKRLGCTQGWEQPITRPKGMWRRTYAQYEKRYRELDMQCSYAAEAFLSRLGG